MTPPHETPQQAGAALLAPYMARMPLVAILRGVGPDEVVEIGDALVEAGFAIIEVPLNSPDPFDSIARLVARHGETCLIGAGTVTDPVQVDSLVGAGGRLVVMPHGDPAVIRAAVGAGLACTPGIATPTEGFAALKAGASALKMFPADALGPQTLKAWRSVLPKGTPFLPVGGVLPGTVADWVAAGAAGFGLGSALYKAGQSAEAVGRAAREFVAAWRAAQS